MGKTGIAALILGLLGATSYRLQVTCFNPTTSRVSQAEVLSARVPETEVTTITMMAVGDIMLSRSVDEQMKRRNDWTWPFASTAAELAAADLTWGNLETPVLPNCPPMTNRMVFCASEKSVAGLLKAGIDAVSLANNHSLNMGQDGLKITEKILEANGIRGIKEGETETMEIRGIKLALISFDDVSKQVKTEEIEQQVASAAAASSMVMVMPHWGAEYVATPSARQLTLAQKLWEAGADIIVGSHPHWTQTVEQVGEKLVIYSLGNFVFDQMWSEETRSGHATRFELQMLNDKLRAIDYRLMPIKIYDYGQTRWINGE